MIIPTIIPAATPVKPNYRPVNPYYNKAGMDKKISSPELHEDDDHTDIDSHDDLSDHEEHDDHSDHEEADDHSDHDDYVPAPYYPPGPIPNTTTPTTPAETKYKGIV